MRSAGRVGGLLPAPAAALGVLAGTPVIAGTLDSYADVAGTAAGPGTGCLLLGSTLVAYAVVPEPVLVPGLEVQRQPAPGVLVGGSSVCGGATLDWLNELLGPAPDDLHALDPGAGGLLALPYLAGERTPVNDPHASGAVLGLTYATTHDELCRAFIDAVALSALDHAERMRAYGVDPARWRVTGGATNNARVAARVLRRARQAARRDAARRRGDRAGGARATRRGGFLGTAPRANDRAGRAPHRCDSPRCSRPTGPRTPGWRRRGAASPTCAESSSGAERVARLGRADRHPARRDHAQRDGADRREHEIGGAVAEQVPEPAAGDRPDRARGRPGEVEEREREARVPARATRPPR